MLTKYFYHASIKRALAVFGTLFNNISVVRRDDNGKILHTEQKVPLFYGPSELALTKTQTQRDVDFVGKGDVAIVLPRMSFEMVSLSYDTETALPMLRQTTHRLTNSETTGRPINALNTNNYSPYKLNIQLTVKTKFMDDGLQILEQILPYFRPDFIITIRQLNEDAPASIWDMPIVLQSVSPNVSYEGDFLTNREITFILDFELGIRLFGPTASQGVIRKIIANFNDMDTQKLLENVTIEAIDDETQELGYRIDTTFFSLVDRIGDMLIEGDLSSSEIENDILTATGIISED